MPSSPTKASKLAVMARVAAQQAANSRGWGALWKAGRTTAAHFGRILRQLWHEVTGFVFLCLAIITGGALAREYVKYQAGQAALSKVLLAAGVTLLFGWFGVSSFWRSRKKSGR